MVKNTTQHKHALQGIHQYDHKCSAVLVHKHMNQDEIMKYNALISLHVFDDDAHDEVCCFLLLLHNGTNFGCVEIRLQLST